MLPARLPPVSKRFRPYLLILFSAIAVAFPATAGDSSHDSSHHGPISVHKAEIRATAGAMTSTGGYARIENVGHDDVALIKVDVEFAANAEIHMMFAEDGVMKMRPLNGSLVIPAHGEVSLKPGRNHLMFMGLTTVLKPDSIQHINFHFDNGQMVVVMATVKKPADIDAANNDHSNRDHSSSDHAGHDHSGG